MFLVILFCRPIAAMAIISTTPDITEEHVAQRTVEKIVEVPEPIKVPNFRQNLMDAVLKDQRF